MNLQMILKMFSKLILNNLIKHNLQIILTMLKMGLKLV